MEKCAFCGKKLGGFNGKHQLKDSDLEFCNLCFGKVEYYDVFLNKSNSFEELENNYVKLKDDIKKLCLTEDIYEKLMEHYAPIYEEAKLIVAPREEENKRKKEEEARLEAMRAEEARLMAERKVEEQKEEKAKEEINSFLDKNRQELSISFQALQTKINKAYEGFDGQEVIAINPQYEYDVVSVYDKKTGGTDIEEVQLALMKHAIEGWKLVSVFTNELGKNSSSTTIGGFGSGTNATIDQVVMIFERMVRKPLK